MAMRFHLCHGTAITLSAGQTCATRDPNMYHHGLVFSEQTIRVNQRIALRLGHTAQWAGALRLGVTSTDPATLHSAPLSAPWMRSGLPDQAHPDLVRREGFWVRVIPEKLVSLPGSYLVLNLTSLGQLQLFVNGHHKGALLLGLPTSRKLWLLLDIYGNTDSASFVSADDVPHEIVARGAPSIEAYELACASGSQPVRRTRLMLVGKENAGKTCLKKALTGQWLSPQEERPGGIDLSVSCSFSPSRNRASWSMSVKGEETSRRERLQDSVDLGMLGGIETLEEEQNQALATNIALELMVLMKQQCSGVKPVFRDTLSTKEQQTSAPFGQQANKDILLVSGPSSDDTTTSTLVHEDIPPRIAEVVEQIMKRKEQEKSKEEEEKEKSLLLLSSESTSCAEGEHNEREINTADMLPKAVDKKEEELVKDVEKGKNRDDKLQGDDSVVLSIWDFAGQASYYTTHQVFLTHRAVYCLVFDLCDELTRQGDDIQEKNNQSGSSTASTTLQYLDFWMRSIHAHAAENACKDVSNTTLSPPIFLVGTHRDLLATDDDTKDDLVNEKFAIIQEFLVGKPYALHVVLPFFSVNNMAAGDDSEIVRLRTEIEQIAGKQSYMGEHIPTKWLRFEQDITDRADSGINFVSYTQISELANNHGIDEQKDLTALLQFYHDLGTIVHYNDCSKSTSNNNTHNLNNNNNGGNVIDNRQVQPQKEGQSEADCHGTVSSMVVLNPQWLIDMFSLVTSTCPPKEKWGVVADKWAQLTTQGVLDHTLLPLIWPDTPDDHRSFLLSVMAKFDLLCQRLPPAGQSHKHIGQSWYIPMRFGPVKEKKKVYVQTSHDAVFYIDFSNFLPEGLFHRLQSRAIVWTQSRGGRDIYLSQGLMRVFVDGDHDLALEMCSPHLHCIKVLVMHVKEKEATSSKRNTPPTPESVAKVRNFLENSLCELRALWMKRLAYKFCFSCPCRKVCELHQVEGCTDLDCMHFLDMDECLTSQVVCCEHRRVQTESFKKWFPPLNSNELKEPVLGPVHIEESYGNIERHMPNLPSWLKGAAKLLNGAPDNQDWLALAKIMGYNQNRIETLNEDLNPPLALLTDWIVSSGNTTMSVDVLLHYLKQLGCDDVADIILQAKEHELERPQVFLSYQWDVQDQVAALRDHLERAGYSCWMDIGQMGGGDQLSAKIDQGLRACKVVVACITPKYTASHLCNRELGLADLLHKPILPVVMETVGWPPPGGMAVILSQLVHINMKGVGGHGGTGIHADLQDKYNEIVQRISQHTQPDLVPCVDSTIISPPAPTGIVGLSSSNRLSGYMTSMSSLSEVDFEGRSGRSGSHHLPNLRQRDASLDVMLSRYDDVLGPTDDMRRHRHTANSQRMEGAEGYSQGRRGSRSSFTNRGPIPQANVKKCAVCVVL